MNIEECTHSCDLRHNLITDFVLLVMDSLQKQSLRSKEEYKPECCSVSVMAYHHYRSLPLLIGWPCQLDLQALIWLS